MLHLGLPHRIVATSFSADAEAVSGTLGVTMNRPFSESLRASEQASIVGASATSKAIKRGSYVV